MICADLLYVKQEINKYIYKRYKEREIKRHTKEETTSLISAQILVFD